MYCIRQNTEKPCGSELAREGVRSVNEDVDWIGPFASKLAPTGYGSDAELAQEGVELFAQLAEPYAGRTRLFGRDRRAV